MYYKILPCTRPGIRWKRSVRDELRPEHPTLGQAPYPLPLYRYDPGSMGWLPPGTTHTTAGERGRLLPTRQPRRGLGVVHTAKGPAVCGVRSQTARHRVNILGVTQMRGFGAGKNRYIFIRNGRRSQQSTGSPAR